MQLPSKAATKLRTEWRNAIVRYMKWGLSCVQQVCTSAQTEETIALSLCQELLPQARHLESVWVMPFKR